MVPRELRCARSSFSKSCKRAEAGFTSVGVPGSGVSEAQIISHLRSRAMQRCWQLEDIPDERIGVLVP